MSIEERHMATREAELRLECAKLAAGVLTADGRNPTIQAVLDAAKEFSDWVAPKA